MDDNWTYENILIEGKAPWGFRIFKDENEFKESNIVVSKVILKNNYVSIKQPLFLTISNYR